MHYSKEKNASLSQSVSLPSFAVLGQNATFRQGNSRTLLFNPTNSTPPFFQVFNPDFLSVLGKNAFVRQIAVNKTFGSGFAFEAPVFNAPTNEVFFASSVFVPESSFNHSNHISKISMTQVEREIAAGVPVINVPFETVSAFRRKLYLRLDPINCRLVPDQSSGNSSNHKWRYWAYQRIYPTRDPWARKPPGCAGSPQPQRTEQRHHAAR